MPNPLHTISRRMLLRLGAGSVSVLPFVAPRANAQDTRSFANWIDGFRARAMARGVSDATYNA